MTGTTAVDKKLFSFKRHLDIKQIPNVGLTTGGCRIPLLQKKAKKNKAFLRYNDTNSSLIGSLYQ